MIKVNDLKVGKTYRVDYEDYASFHIVSRDETHTTISGRKLYANARNVFNLSNDTEVLLYEETNL